MLRHIALAVTLMLTAPAAAGAQSSTDVQAQVDRIFAKWTTETPGCAVGVSIRGREVLARAYGMADLEHDVRNTPATITRGS